MFLVISMEVIVGIYESFMRVYGVLLWYYPPAMENPRTKWTCFFLQEIIELNEGNSINGGPQDGWLMENTCPKNGWFFRVPPAIRKPPNGIVRLINVGKTMSFLPPMTGNGNHTTYWWWWLGDGLWHCFTDITPSSFRGRTLPRIRMSGRSGCVPQHLRHHDHQSSIVHQYIRRDDGFSGRDFMVSSWLFNNCLIVIECLFNGSQWWFTGEWNLMAIKPCKTKDLRELAGGLGVKFMARTMGL